MLKDSCVTKLIWGATKPHKIREFIWFDVHRGIFEMRAKCLPRSPRNSLTFRTQDSLCSEVNQDIVVEAMFRSSSGHFHSSRKYCKIFIFYNFTNLCVLHGQVFVMILRFYVTFDFVGLDLKLVLRAVGQGHNRVNSRP